MKNKKSLFFYLISKVWIYRKKGISLLLLTLVSLFGITTAVASTAQLPKKIEGSVVDELGMPLIGVNIIVKGSSNGTITDIDGKYALSIDNSKGIIVKYSLIGYKMKEVLIKGESTLNIILKEDSELLDEVVVVGYGIQKKINVTGAVGSIDRKELMTVSTSNLTNSLQGKIPGLNIKQNTSEPGAYDNGINIRGLGSPLIIVDGIPRGDFDRIDPNELESVSILKDASAAVYGVRAANGVILITTRKGSAGKSEITLNAAYGTQSITKYPKTCDAYGYIDLYNEAMANTGSTEPTYSPDLITSGSPYTNINWFDEMVNKSVPQYQMNFTASGGSDKVKYFTSMGYHSEEGIWKTNSLDYERYNIRSNISANVSDDLVADFQIGGYIDNKNAPSYDNLEIFKSIGFAVPIYEIYANGNHDYLGSQFNDDLNPLIKASNEYGGYNKRKNTQVQLSASLTWKIPFVKGLSAKALVAYDPKFYSQKMFRKQYRTYTYDPLTESYPLKSTSTKSAISEWKSNSATVTTQLSLSYEKKIKESHNLNVLALFESRKWENSELSGGRSTLMDAVDQIYAGLVDDSRIVNGASDRNANLGLVGRLDYDYLSKYLLQASFRYDGSSKFYNKKWGFFPSISVGWRISEESFFKENLKFVDNLKIRASMGKLGDDNAASFLWLMAFDYPSSDNYMLGDTGITPGVGMPQIPNKNATWFTATTKNIGFDCSLWNSALTIEFDFFRRDRNGLLANRIATVPGTFGASFAQENLNSDMHFGYELALGHNGKVGDFSYQIHGNVTWTQARNKYIERTPSGNSYDNWRQNQVDRNKNINWIYNTTGQYTSSEDYFNNPVLGGKYFQYDFLPGDIKYEDFNEDGMIDEWDLQPIIRGNVPTIDYGLSLGIQWKGIDVSAFLQGGALFNARVPSTPLQWGGNSWDLFLDRWHKVDGEGNLAPFDPNAVWVSGKYPSTRIISPLNNPNSSFWYRNCSYLRLKNVEIGYTFPNSLIKYIGAKALRVYANGFNLLTFSSKDLGYIDPENPGGDIYQYPIMKNFNIGLNVTF